MSNITITEIPADIPTDVNDLRIKGTSIHKVKGGVLNKLINCEEIDFGENKITSIEVGAFKGLITIRSRYGLWNHNRISELQPETFSGLRELKPLEIHLDHNLLTVICTMELFLD